jgi:hypothetical protein
MYLQLSIRLQILIVEHTQKLPDISRQQCHLELVDIARDQSFSDIAHSEWVCFQPGKSRKQNVKIISTIKTSYIIYIPYLHCIV